MNYFDSTQELLPPKHDKYILIKNKVFPALDEKFWVKWMRDNNRKLRSTRIGLFRPIYVSTVFLGLDHGDGGIPVLFETAIFGGSKHDSEMIRYCTYRDAVDGHDKVVDAIRGKRLAFTYV